MVSGACSHLRGRHSRRVIQRAPTAVQFVSSQVYFASHDPFSLIFASCDLSLHAAQANGQPIAGGLLLE